MPRDLEIFKRDDWFLKEEQRDNGNPGYPIYYRYAITYSIAKNVLDTQYKNDKGKDQEWVIEEIDNLIKSIEENKPYKSDDFIELYPLAGNMGYVLIDQTDSYYPLMFYSSANNRSGKPRVNALKYSLEDIKQGLDEIYNKISQLETIKKWTPGFQRQLYCLFPDNSNLVSCS